MLRSRASQERPTTFVPLIRYPAALAASDLARKLRAASERALRRSGAPQVWAPSYFVASVGSDTSGRIDKFVREQEQVINS